MKRQATDLEKRFANQILDKELISRVYKKLKLNNKKLIQCFLKGKDSEKIFPLEKSINCKKNHKKHAKMLSVISPQGNANQNLMTLLHIH